LVTVAVATRILGLDPGLQITGYAVVESSPRGPTICEAGVIKGADTPAAKPDTPRRLANLYSSLVEILDQFQPAEMAVEQLYSHYAHPRTAVLMGHARGVLLLAAAQREIPVTSYNPTQIKKSITGHGRASKEQMQHAICRELGLAEVPEPPDVADALAVALCHLYSMKR
jgi:crossover junction endodeoxyribonuclease RuvC